VSEETNKQILQEIRNLLRTLVERGDQSIAVADVDQAALLASRSQPDWMKHGFESAEAWDAEQQLRFDQSRKELDKSGS